jgi:hypothetical protein
VNGDDASLPWRFSDARRDRLAAPSKAPLLSGSPLMATAARLCRLDRTAQYQDRKVDWPLR